MIETFTMFNRRNALTAAAGMLLAPHAFAQDQPSSGKIGFGFGTYGMRSLSTIDAIRVCEEIGYDGIEFALMDGWPTAPTLLSQAARDELRRRLIESQLSVPSLLESLPCLKTDKHHAANLERLKRATELAHALSPQKPPVVQSIAGGKTATWNQDKSQLVDQLADWARVGESSQTVICFKPHAGHSIHNPQRALWIHQQVKSDWLKIVYDYSHFFLAGLSIAESLQQLLPITAYIQVKDSRGTPAKHDYLLPGDGETDYLQLFSELKQARYDGFVGVEVSSHVHRKPGYQPIPTAKLCYDRLSPILDQLEIRLDRPTAR